ncbi:hypothetical protein BSL82_09660 [Tardibacter chloracetimidivorans]|uniref:HTH cro/C1-type domain-containing protein n=1 Tax=Tardibacter chloracetimidivorans TaxID=1921510 RepID=A0A1L3ZVA2_9SPHN|nr:helix-turn-helix transcriptional regulator [Tardibacter chloracetimidivorans]API59547.1 hypothetical protein BSL82_09660 [Tardibacter chloracetimidivorans]
MAGLDRAAFRAARKRKRLSQQKLADILGVEQPAVQQWETGKSSPRTLDGLRQLCDVLGVSADVLLGREKFPSARFLADVIREAGTTDADELAGILHKRLLEMIGG